MKSLNIYRVLLGFAGCTAGLFPTLLPGVEDELGPYPFSELRELPLKSETKVYGDKIRRTMHLLSSSTKHRPNKVKILFFGQSITRANKSREVIEAKLRERYPHAQLEVENRAIGGYEAPYLLPTMYQNLIPLQPDLVVFHVYGGEGGEYEEILQNMRAFTTAEIVTITHHLDNYGEARTKQRDLDSQLRRELAGKYECELVEVREQWKTYLDMHSLDVEGMLRDKIHHNTHGGELWGALQARHFEVYPADPKGWENRISRMQLGDDKSSALGYVEYSDGEWTRDVLGLHSKGRGSKLRVVFEGTRVDVVSRRGEGVAQILIDGKVSSALANTWAATQPSKTPIDYRPAIRRVGISGKPETEIWKLTADFVSDDGKAFTYRLDGSLSGFQGKGDHTGPFVSNNGVITLLPEHFTWDHAIQIKKTSIPVPAQVTWELYPTSLDEWSCEGATEENPSGQVTLVQQLENGKHVLEIVSGGELSINEVLLYKPGLPDIEK